ncbi:hypothetical protein HNQ43_001428 [Faecalicoccus acidiformans]|uniref:Uncharacterized protein n=1 Tax=Faecalicoccus acidiformans TaxID=915173 RepID=A0A7W8D3M9_9FIRM|nr:hypothetical protein [Faecalicoccus acidiformans]MBB5185374.1 hypothetical protein [Faecalicoccus acidiformans]
MDKKNQQPKKGEIDDFAKALLNKKTDMAIYADEQKKEDADEDQSVIDRKEAEQTLSSALDLLRKERGQSTIAEEEKRFYYSQLEENDGWEEEDDDFTTSSIEDLKTQSFDVESVAKALSDYDQNQEVKAKLKVDLNKSNAKGIAHKEEEKPKKKSRSKKKSRKLLPWIILVIVLGLGCLGGYAYKVYVWNPAHIVTEDMEKAYDRLVAYADEYGSDLDSSATLMSDSERLELLNMKEDYEMLNETQKSAINEYFQEQTKMTYLELVDELETFQEQVSDPENESYKTISDLLSKWSSLTASQQYQIIDLEAGYQDLPKVLQDRIDELASSNANTKFEKLVSQLRESRDASAQQQQQQLSSLQSQLSSLQSQLATNQQYASTLETELQTAQASGDSETIADLNTAIASNNDTISNLEKQIETIQAQINQLNQ